MLDKTKTAQPNVINGVNLDDVTALINGVKNDAAKGMTHWRVNSAWQGQTRSRSKVDGFEIGGERVPRQFTIDIDEPYELGGSNRHANPQEHLLAALNACMMVGYVAQCSLRGITLEKLEIESGRRHRPPRLSRARSGGVARLPPTELRGPHQGQRHPGAVRRDPQGGDGHLAEFPQRVSARGSRADACRGITTIGSKEAADERLPRFIL